MSDVDEFLEHFGVKGMKWGVRKTEADGSPRQRGAIRSSITKSVTARGATNSVIRERGDHNTFLPADELGAFHEKVHSNVSRRLTELNSDPRFKGKDIKFDEPLKKEYHREAKTIAKQAYSEELSSARVDVAVRVGVEIVQSIRQARAESRQPRSEAEVIQLRALATAGGPVKHADSDDVLDELEFEITRNDLGQIESLAAPEVKHYGVKGMKWGVNRRDTSPQAVSVSQPKPGGRVKATGGKNQPASEDAKKAAAARQTARKSTTDALSNKELQELVTRMNLEQQYARLSAPQQTAGQKFAKALLGDLGKQKIAANLDQQAEEDPKMEALASAFRRSSGLGNKPKEKNKDK